MSDTSANWTHRQVARVTKNALIASGVNLAAIGLIVWLSSGYLGCFFRGPIQPDDDELLRLVAERGERSLIAYVNLRGRQFVETEWREVSTADGRPYSVIPFFLTQVGDKYLLTLSKAPAASNSVVGPLGPLREMDEQVIASTVAKHPELAGKVLPARLNAEAAFNVWGYVLLTLLLPWASLTGWSIARAIAGRITPEFHPVAKRLMDSPSDMTGSRAIDDEMAGEDTIPIGKATLTPSWFVRPTLFGMKAVRLDEVVWIYQVRQQSESFLVFAFRSGRKLAVSLRDSVIPDAIRFIHRRRPWILVGYEADRDAAWRRDSRPIIAEVEARRTGA